MQNNEDVCIQIHKTIQKSGSELQSFQCRNQYSHRQVRISALTFSANFRSDFTHAVFQRGQKPIDRGFWHMLGQPFGRIRINELF